MQNAQAGPAPLILLFDGDCLLCDGVVRWLTAHDRHQRLRFAAFDSVPGQQLLQALGLPPDFRDSFVVIEGKKHYLRSAGVLRVLSALGQGWRILAYIGGLIPLRLRDALYRWVARNRYRWFGRRATDETCDLPSPALRARLLH